jgi:hypothetical protein
LSEPGRIAGKETAPETAPFFHHLRKQTFIETAAASTAFSLQDNDP